MYFSTNSKVRENIVRGRCLREVFVVAVVLIYYIFLMFFVLRRAKSSEYAPSCNSYIVIQLAFSMVFSSHTTVSDDTIFNRLVQITRNSEYLLVRSIYYCIQTNLFLMFFANRDYYNNILYNR